MISSCEFSKLFGAATLKNIIFKQNQENVNRDILLSCFFSTFLLQSKKNTTATLDKSDVYIFIINNSLFPLSTIIFIIFWDFFMFYQIFFSPQVKRCAIITYKRGIYDLPHELPNDLKSGSYVSQNLFQIEIFPSLVWKNIIICLFDV